MLMKFLLSLFILAALPGESVVLPNYYEDLDDTTSFTDCYQLNHNSTYGLHYAEVFGVNDTYDYCKYTAPYTRSVMLILEAEEGFEAYVDVFVAGISMTTPLLSYSSTSNYGPNKTVFVYQDNSVFFRVRCSGNCWWNVTLMTIPCASVATYVSYDRFYGYDMPYYGIPDIYYTLDESCYTLVEGQNFTYADVLDEAAEIWESVGNINLEKSTSRAYFNVEIDSSATPLDVVHTHELFLDNYYCSEFKMTDNILVYNSMIDGMIAKNGRPAFMRQAVLGLAVIGFGLALGCVINNSNQNVTGIMSMPFSFYDGLGDGDIRSLINLWGDANNATT